MEPIKIRPHHIETLFNYFHGIGWAYGTPEKVEKLAKEDYGPRTGAALIQTLQDLVRDLEQRIRIILGLDYICKADGGCCFFSDCEEGLALTRMIS